jgi:2-methylcitrate dehydratase PrpD
METPWLETLARACAGDDLASGEAVCAALANTALDWAGAAIAGTAHPWYPKYLAAFAACAGPAAPHGCTVLGDDRAWPVVDAAAVNAAISHFWEFDDVHRSSTMHPGITVYPAVFALAQTLAKPDVGLMRAAVVAGYEAGTRVGTLLGKQHYAISHTTATAGCFAAAAAAAKMLGLTAEQILWAFGHAGTQAAGLWQFLDDGAVDAKPFHAASAVRNGLTAAFMAQAGITGATRILEGKRGMMAAWKLDRNSGQEHQLHPGATPEINRATIKSWPVCGQMHSLLDATEALIRRPDFAAGPFARIRVDVPTPLLDIADVKHPTTLSALKFSTSFCVALLLSGHALPFSGLDEAWLTDPNLHALAARIDVVADPAFDRRFPKERPARITIWPETGTPLTEERSFRRGDPEEPWTWEPLTRRFRDISGIAGIGAASQDEIIAWCAGFGRGDESVSKGFFFEKKKQKTFDSPGL